MYLTCVSNSVKVFPRKKKAFLWSLSLLLNNIGTSAAA